MVGYTEAIANLLPLTARAAYAASRISSNLKGTTKQFGWLQASATKDFLPPQQPRLPRNHPNRGAHRAGSPSGYSETRARSGARCWRKCSVCEIPFCKIVFELGIPIGSDVFVEKIQQSLDFRRQP